MLGQFLFHHFFHLFLLHQKTTDQFHPLTLQSNSEQLDDFDHSKDKNKMTSTPVRQPFGNKNEKYENLLKLNQSWDPSLIDGDSFL